MKIMDKNGPGKVEKVLPDERKIERKRKRASGQYHLDLESVACKSCGTDMLNRKLSCHCCGQRADAENGFRF